MPRRDDAAAIPIVDWRTVVTRACERKVAYTDPKDARDAWRRIADGALRVYRCPFSAGCPHWHLGHVPKPDEVRRIAAAIRARAQELGATA